MFFYLENVMHFADLHRGEQDMDAIFGEDFYEADVRKPDFFERF
jgi:hypothetical protein